MPAGTVAVMGPSVVVEVFVQTSSSVYCEPGTRNMSPKEQKITLALAAIACALSMVSSGVTQTGHPGPCTSSTVAGSNSSRPCRTMVWV